MKRFDFLPLFLFYFTNIDSYFMHCENAITQILKNAIFKNFNIYTSVLIYVYNVNFSSIKFKYNILISYIEDCFNLEITRKCTVLKNSPKISHFMTQILSFFSHCV